MDCGKPWTLEHIHAAVARGNHPSARTDDAIACIQAETLEKVKQGYARLVSWDDIKDDPPPNLKISPVAAIPHKSRTYRTILDLSYQLLVAGIPLPSVNAATKKLAPAQSMKELGNVLPRLIAAVAKATPTTDHIFFAKWDIKDGFWRMVVSKNEAWNFCFLLCTTSQTK